MPDQKSNQMLNHEKNQSDNTEEWNSLKDIQFAPDASEKPAFNVDPEDFPIFSQQAGLREDEYTGKMENRTLNINETLGLMVGQTAKTIAAIQGEKNGIPKIDHVIYLDKSARPVSWLVDDFWDDFADTPAPEKSYLAIDRRPWFDMVGIELVGHEEIRDPDGTLRPAKGSDFWKAYENVPEEKKKEWSARIRALYIEGGIDSEDPDVIMSTPTVLDGKNLLIIDEVSRSGSTIEIAVGLLKRAIPELASVNGHVFWNDGFSIRDGETQMGNAPVWYPKDPSDWRGRGVRDIDPSWYEAKYRSNPSKMARAERYGAFVLGVPLVNREEEPGELSWKLREEMRKMHQAYEAGKILPNLPASAETVLDKMIEKLESFGVEFVPASEAAKNPNSYSALAKKRDQKPTY